LAIIARVISVEVFDCEGNFTHDSLRTIGLD
jgi:hypothetical protein